ncbi:hypothetical protein BH18ACI5_BH18ACI5_06640 [soil metagenome]
MEKHLLPSLVSHPWGAQVQRLVSPGGAFAPGDRMTTATTHGGLDDDSAVQEAVVRHIKGASHDRVQRPAQIGARNSDEEAADSESPSAERQILERIVRTP